MAAKTPDRLDIAVSRSNRSKQLNALRRYVQRVMESPHLTDEDRAQLAALATFGKKS